MLRKTKRPVHPETISEQLRNAIRNCGESRYRISLSTGISQGTLSKFMHREHGLAQQKIDLLGKYLGLRLVSDAPELKGK